MSPSPQQNDDLDAVVRHSVRETLLQMGLVTTSDTDMRETQKDFAYLRELRVGSQAMKNKGILAVIGIVVTALATLIWIGLNALFHNGAVPPHS